MSTATVDAAAGFGGFPSSAQKSPPLRLPLLHFGFAALAFWFFTAALAVGGAGRMLGFDLDARWLLGLVHLLTLGWVTMTILGVMVQMTTVLLDVPLFSAKLIEAAWWIFLAGLAGFIGHLWAGKEEYWLPAIAILSAFFLYLYVLARTILSAPRLDWSGRHLSLAVGYLGLAGTLGLLLAFDRQRGILFSDPEGALIAHVHLALIGWVSLTIFGASYKLVSMFALSHTESKRWGRFALLLVNFGLVGLALDALFFGRRLLPLWTAALLLGYAAYAFQMRAIFAGRIRRLDPSLGFTLLALVGGGFWAALGASLAFGWIPDGVAARQAYIFAALLGWVTPTILGQSYKIVPFLVWLHLYQPKNWKPGMKILRMQDLSKEGLAWAQAAAFLPGLVIFEAALWLESPLLLRIGSLFLLLTATLYVFNLLLALRHLFRRVPA